MSRIQIKQYPSASKPIEVTFNTHKALLTMEEAEKMNNELVSVMLAVNDTRI